MLLFTPVSLFAFMKQRHQRLHTGHLQGARHHPLRSQTTHGLDGTLARHCMSPSMGICQMNGQELRILQTEVLSDSGKGLGKWFSELTPSLRKPENLS